MIEKLSGAFFCAKNLCKVQLKSLIGTFFKRFRIIHFSTKLK